MKTLDALSDDDLLRCFGSAVSSDNRNNEELLRLIDAVGRRRLWAELAHSSMFDFCVKRFHMSEAVAGKRIGVARLARHFPVIFEMIGRGDVHLSAVLALKTVLTEENHERVLAEAKHKTLREVEALRAKVAPRPDVPSRVRALARPRENPMAMTAGAVAETLPVLGPTPPSVPSTPRPSKRAPDPEPLAPRRYKLEVTIGEETQAKLSQLQDLLAHTVPNGDPAVIVERALDVLLEQTLKTKAAVTERPRKRSGKTKGRQRRVPAALRRAVWKRDGGCCAFVATDGRRCDETRCLEFAHLEPWAKGGEHSVDNIALRCRGHNHYEAVRDYGELFMAEKRGEPRGVRERAATYAISSMVFTCRAASKPTRERGTVDTILKGRHMPFQSSIDLASAMSASMMTRGTSQAVGSSAHWPCASQ